MKRFLPILLIAIIGSCVSSPFNKQRYTDLKHLKPFPEQVLTPPDSLKTADSVDVNRVFAHLESDKRPVYLKTEKGYYKVKQPSYDAGMNWVKAEDIRLASEPERRETIILHITEKNFRMLDAVDLHKVDSIYINGIPVDKPRVSSNYQDRRRQQGEEETKTIVGVVLLIFAALFGGLALWWYNESLNQPTGCGGLMASLAAASIAAIFGVTAGIFAIIGIIMIAIGVKARNR